jgi:hypothetical protein
VCEMCMLVCVCGCVHGCVCVCVCVCVCNQDGEQMSFQGHQKTEDFNGAGK